MEKQQRTKLPVFMQIILVIVVLALVLVLIPIGGYAAYKELQNPTLSLPTNTTVVMAVQHVGKLETTTYTIQQIIVYNPTSWWSFLGSSKKLFVVYGTVTAGIDLSTLQPNDVQIQGKAPDESATLNAPATQILSATIDPTRTQVYDANTGIYSVLSQNIGPNTTIQILAAAQNTLQGDACKDGILQQAADSAKGQLTSLLTTLGFSPVTVSVSVGTCS